MATINPMYEVMYIINPVLSDDQTTDIVNRVGDYLKENGAVVLETDEMGSQRLAYPIEKKRNGYYVVTHFRAPGKMIARFDRALRLNDDILRHLILRYDAKMERHFQGREKRAAEVESADE